MNFLEMSPEFFLASTNAGLEARRTYTVLRWGRCWANFWRDFDAAYCMGGEL